MAAFRKRSTAETKIDPAQGPLFLANSDPPPRSLMEDEGFTAIRLWPHVDTREYQGTFHENSKPRTNAEQLVIRCTPIAGLPVVAILTRPSTPTDLGSIETGLENSRDDAMLYKIAICSTRASFNV